MSSRRGKSNRLIIFILCLLLLFGLVVIIGNRVFSYETDKTHPSLVALAARIYNNQTTGHSLTKREISWLQSGAMDEDTPNRWLNHFYDPIHNQGLKGKYLTAKDWATDSQEQSKYALGDKTWQRALADYRQGDKESAFKELGHVLHLLADVTVPAHTRDDLHILGDSYEQFVWSRWSVVSKNLFSTIIQVNDLSTVFVELAYYTNTNFFSDDTIVSKKYKLPQLTETSFNGGYFTRDLAGRTSKLLHARQSVLFRDLYIYRLDQAVLSDYASYLLPKAVGYAVGVIDLFFREVASGSQNYVLSSDRIGWQGNLDQLSGAVVSGLDDLYEWIKPGQIEQAGEDGVSASIDDQVDINNATAVDIQTPADQSENIEQETATATAQDVPAASSFVYSSGLSQPALPQIISSDSTVTSDNSSSSAAVIIASLMTTSSSVELATTSSFTDIFDLFLPSIFNSGTMAMASTSISFDSVSSTLAADSVSSSVIIQPMNRSVVINEVAWAGTHKEYPNDEWLELYNNSSSSIDISKWKILLDGQELKITKYNNQILAPFSYYLLERSDDDTIKQITADAIFSGGLKNSGAKIELLDAAGVMIDQVDCSSGWFAGDDIKYRSMERIDASPSGDEFDNWQSNQGIRQDGRSYHGAPIYGSPKRANFGFIALNYRQEDDLVTLTKVNNPYVLQYYEIPTGKTLRIEPGVVVKSYYNNSFIDVYGKLDIMGSSTDRVIFSSGRDDSFNNSLLDTTVGNWNDTDPQAGDWQGFWFHSSSSADLVGLDMRYAGADFSLANYLPPITSQGIRAQNADMYIGDSLFSHHVETILYLDNASSTIINSRFSDSDLAIETKDGSLALDGLEFNNINNGSGPVRLSGRWPEFANLKFSGTTRRSMMFGQVEIKNQQVSLKPDWTYIFSNLTIDSSSALKIEAGTKIELATYGTMIIDGSLEAWGTADQPIIIGDNVGWGYLMFNNSNSTLKHVKISGGGGLASEQDAAIMVQDSDLVITDSKIWNSRAPGNSIKAVNSILQIVDSQIGMDNKWPDPAWAGMSYTTGVRMVGGALFLNNVDFSNLNYAVFKAKYNDELPEIMTDNMSDSNYINVYRQYAW